MVQDQLIDVVAREFAETNRAADLLEIGSGVGQGEAGTAGAEVAQRDDPVLGNPGRAFSAVSAAVASEINVGGPPLAARSG